MACCLVADRCLHRVRRIAWLDRLAQPRTSRRTIDLAAGAGAGGFSCRTNGQDLECRSGCWPAPAAARDRDVVVAVHWPLGRPGSDIDFVRYPRRFWKPSQRDRSVGHSGSGRMEPVLSAAGRSCGRRDGNRCFAGRRRQRSNRASCRCWPRCRRTGLVASPRSSDDRGAHLSAGRPHDRHARGQARPAGTSAPTGHQRGPRPPQLQCVSQSLPD